MSTEVPKINAPNPRAGRRTLESPDTDEHKVLGSRLKEAREALGLTQADVAGALDIPRSGVAAFEAGERKVTGLELRRLARLYRRSVSWLLGETADEEVAADAALYRAAEKLRPQDKEQVLRFAQFLAAQRPVDGVPAHARLRPQPPGDLGG